jgi:hypothetical protein
MTASNIFEGDQVHGRRDCARSKCREESPFKTKDAAHFFAFDEGEVNGRFNAPRCSSTVWSITEGPVEWLNGWTYLPGGCARWGFGDGTGIEPHGENARCAFEIARGNVQVHWPEGNVLLGEARDPSVVPDFNALVDLVKAESATYRKTR